MAVGLLAVAVLSRRQRRRRPSLRRWPSSRRRTSLRGALDLSTLWALDGGPQCSLSLLRNGNVPGRAEKLLFPHNVRCQCLTGTSISFFHIRSATARMPYAMHIVSRIRRIVSPLIVIQSQSIHASVHGKCWGRGYWEPGDEVACSSKYMYVFFVLQQH